MNDEKLIKIIEDIWNAGYESDISISNEEWAAKIKEVTRVCYLCGDAINVCNNCDE